jgi:xylan 1,4-beta-xylosidase
MSPPTARPDARQAFAAAFVTRIIMEAHGLVEAASGPSVHFAESYFPSVPFHGGFGL